MYPSRLIILVITMLSLGTQSKAQTWRYVKSGGAGTANGSSWTNASADLQAMITASAAGDFVWVAAGTYQPASGTSYSMKEGVSILGGFPATGTPVLSDRNPLTNISILKGNGSRVITNNANSLTNAALIDGFTITGGSIQNMGGGMYCNNASPTISNCIFSGNTAVGHAFSPTLEAYGGGLYISNASPKITSCIFSGNTVTGYNTGGFGGGIYSSSALTLSNCSVAGNYIMSWAPGSGNSYGAGIYGAAGITLYNCTVAGNYGKGTGSGSTGSGIYAVSTVSGANNIVYGNSATLSPELYSGGANNLSYSLVKGLTATSNGNLDGSIADPVFTSPVAATSAPSTTGNYTLQHCSAAINAGDNSQIPSGLGSDLNASSRILDGTVDMGAYEGIAFTLPATAGETNSTPGDCIAGSWHHFYNTTGNKLVLAINSANVSISSLTVTGALNAKYGTGNINPLTAPFGLADYLYPLNRSWTVVASTTPAGPVSVRFFFNDQDSTDLAAAYHLSSPLSTLVLYKVAGTDAYDPAATGYTEYSYAAAPDLTHFSLGTFQGFHYAEFQVSSFSSGTLALRLSSPLPLRLISFGGTSRDCIASLQWTTSAESNLSSIGLQSSSNGIDYTTVQTLQPFNTPGEHSYQATQPITDPSTWYRLKIEDIDQKNISYSNIIRLTAACGIARISINPNPAHDIAYIDDAIAGSIYAVYDNSGRKLLSGRIGSAHQSLAIHGISPGLYHLTIISQNKTSQNLKLLIL